MSTTIVVAVREDSEGFHGRVAHVAIQGDGSPRHFDTAVKLAMREAATNLPTAARVREPLRAPQLALVG